MGECLNYKQQRANIDLSDTASNMLANITVYRLSTVLEARRLAAPGAANNKQQQRATTHRRIPSRHASHNSIIYEDDSPMQYPSASYDPQNPRSVSWLPYRNSIYSIYSLTHCNFCILLKRAPTFVFFSEITPGTDSTIYKPSII